MIILDELGTTAVYLSNIEWMRQSLAFKKVKFFRTERYTKEVIHHRPGSIQSCSFAAA